jgi:hypothetical protein
MNRNSFFKASLAIGIFLTAPFAALAKINSKKRVDKGIKVDSGKDRFGKPISLFDGDTFNTKISTADTDGDVYVFESTRVKEGGPSFLCITSKMSFGTYSKGSFYLK